MQKNLLSLSFTDQEMQEINELVNNLRAKLEPKLKSLSPDDRREVPKMGDKSLAFVKKTLDYCSKNQEIAPGFLDIEEFERDFKGYEQLRDLFVPISQMSQRLNDSMLLLGSDSYQAALIYYNAVKSAKKSNVANAQSIYEDLSARFVASSKKSQDEA